jgi:phage/plasmid-like protein (TIGR03299 family)
MKIMSANVESMFYARTAPWHNLGIRTDDALSSEEALIKSGLNWQVAQRSILTNEGVLIEGYKANVRDSDNKILGVVTDRYKVVQNHEAFAFTDELLGQGVLYETAGSLAEGKKVWLLAKLPAAYIISGEKLAPYLVFTNSHDGSGSIKVAMTPIRVVCQNTLNLALSTADRIWTTNHTGDINAKLESAKETFYRAEEYMDALGNEIYKLNKVTVSDELVTEIIQDLLPIPTDASELQEKNVTRLRNDITTRYYQAPDLQMLPKNAYRLINAVSDFATHAKPLRETAAYRENLFTRTIEGNALIDKSYQLVKQIA